MVIVAIMRKLLHIVFGVIKNKTQFNPHLVFDGWDSIKAIKILPLRKYQSNFAPGFE